MVPEEEEEEKQVRREPPSFIASHIFSVFVQAFQDGIWLQKGRHSAVVLRVTGVCRSQQRSQSFLHCRSKTSQRIVCPHMGIGRFHALIESAPFSFPLPLSSFGFAQPVLALLDGIYRVSPRGFYDRHKRSMYHIAE